MAFYEIKDGIKYHYSIIPKIINSNSIKYMLPTKLFYTVNKDSIKYTLSKFHNFNDNKFHVISNTYVENSYYVDDKDYTK